MMTGYRYNSDLLTKKAMAFCKANTSEYVFLRLKIAAPDNSDWQARSTGSEFLGIIWRKWRENGAFFRLSYVHALTLDHGQIHYPGTLHNGKKYPAAAARPTYVSQL